MKTSAPYTMMDYNDGINLICKIESNHPQTITYDPATGIYNPDWSSMALTLTPIVVIAGRGGTNILPNCTNKNWKYRRSGEASWTTISNGVGGFTINASNVLGFGNNTLFDSTHLALEFMFSFTYHDDTLNLDFDRDISQSFNRASNGTSLVIARAWSENGEQFKNKREPAEITLSTELIRGTAKDSSDLTYQWQTLSGGVWGNITGKTNTTLTILAEEVDGSAQFRCKITDTDSASDTFNQTFTTNTITILDFTDPYQAVITSSNGAFFKNGAGSTVLTCNVYQDGQEVTSGISYKWYKNGDATLLGTNKTLTITSDMVDVKAEFICEVW